jgi:hypothetical protein
MKPPHAAAHNMAAIVQKSAKWELPKNMAQHVGRKDIMSKAIVVNKWCMSGAVSILRGVWRRRGLTKWDVKSCPWFIILHH